MDRISPILMIILVRMTAKQALEQDLVEVNSLMKDVAAMVGEQQEAIGEGSCN